MNNAAIFKTEHGDFGEITPLRELNNKEYEDIVSNFGLDIDKIYQVNGRLYPFCYKNNTVMIEIYELSKQGFEMFNVIDRINQVEKHHAMCIATKDYTRLFMLIDKPYRFTWFVKLFNDIPDKDRYFIFINIYTSSEYGFNDLPEAFVKGIFRYKDESDYVLPGDILTIYRGEGSLSTHYDKAYSWTLDLDVAKFFANRFDGKGNIYMAKVLSKDVLDYLQDRKESEIIVMPKDVYDIEKL